MNRLIIFLLLSIILGCDSQKNDLEFEKKVFNEIFLELIDSTFYDFRTLQPPLTIAPPPNGIIISESQKKENLRIHKEYLAEFEERKIKIENDTARIVLAIVDTIFTLNQENFERLDKKFKDHSLAKKTEYKLNLSEYKNNKKFIFKYYSEFPKGRKIWKTEYPFHLGAVLSFSRIYFDNSKKNGIIECGVNYGILNGNGFKIFIQKVSGKWKVQKIEGTWIS